MVTRGRTCRRSGHVEGEISIFQSIQLGFSRSLGSATSNEANKSAMWRAEWTRTIAAARSAVLRWAQIKYRYFEITSNYDVITGVTIRNNDVIIDVRLYDVT